MKKVKECPIGLVCTTIAGDRPILPASCSAAPSASARSAADTAGTGSVNDTCTCPSPVVSPYGRTTVLCLPGGTTPDSPAWGAPAPHIPLGNPPSVVSETVIPRLLRGLPPAGRRAHPAW